MQQIFTIKSSSMTFKLLTKIIVIAFINLFAACQDNSVCQKMAYIKVVGNTDPELALHMLDSIDSEVHDADNHSLYLFKLLKIRLNDKANHLATSDIAIQNILPYFEESGTIAEKQEAYYYAGSVYRDLQDTPRALKHFFISLDYAADNPSMCDSVILECTYSNLHVLYYEVQDYNNAAKMAEQELAMAIALGEETMRAYSHLAAAYIGGKNAKKAIAACDSVYANAILNPITDQKKESLTYIFCYYSQLEEKLKADKCFDILFKNGVNDCSLFERIALGRYYKAFGQPLQAIEQYEKLLEESQNIFDSYEASKQLFKLYSLSDDIDNAQKYASLYIAVSDSLDLGKRQQIAATINNQYQYHLDQKKIEDMEKGKQKSAKILTATVFSSVFIICLCIIIFLYRKNRHQHKIIKMSEELNKVKANNNKLRQEIDGKEDEIREHQSTIERYKLELANIQEELTNVNRELKLQEEELKNKEQLLTYKIDQNKNLMKWLKLTEMGNNAEKVVDVIRQKAKIPRNITTIDWEQLYNAVDELHPTLKDRIKEEIGEFTEQHKQVCYLLLIGLKRTEIQNLTGLARVTVWRWSKRFKWVTEKVSEIS